MSEKDLRIAQLGYATMASIALAIYLESFSGGIVLFGMLGFIAVTALRRKPIK